MKRNRWQVCLMLGALGLSMMCGRFCSAQVVEGRAVIVGGDVTKAEQAAREDAMRSYVEQQVGVHITSSTETSLGMVVSDKVLAQSEGYVQVKRVVKSEAQGNIYCVALDLEASADRIRASVQDLRTSLEALDESSSRYGIQVAITGRDENGHLQPTMELMHYVKAKFENQGFRVVENDEVLAYMNRQTDLSDPRVNAEIRRIARSDGRETENALLRGCLSTSEVRMSGAYYEATEHASFELIGLDTSSSNSYDDYFVGVGTTKSEAIKKARDAVMQKAVEELAQKALLTAQDETRGGTRHLKIALVFRGIQDRAGQSAQIRQGLQALGGHIIRSAFGSDGSFKVFADMSGFSSLDELQAAIQAHVPGLQPGNEDEAAMGSTKLYFTY